MYTEKTNKHRKLIDFLQKTLTLCDIWMPGSLFLAFERVTCCLNCYQPVKSFICDILTKKKSQNKTRSREKTTQIKPCWHVVEESVKSANASPPSRPALLSDSGVVMQGQVTLGRLSSRAVRWGWDTARSRRRMWEGKNTHNTAHTNKSWDECDIPTDRMLLEMYTYKRQTAHHAYWLPMAKIESFCHFSNFFISPIPCVFTVR